MDIKDNDLFYNLAANKKSTPNPLFFKNQLLEIKEQYCIYEQIYTDGSKEGEKVGAGTVFDGEV